MRAGRSVLTVHRRAAACVLLGASCVTAASGQIGEARAPVFIANAPLAEDAIETIDALMRRGGEDEAVRLIQRVLEEQGDGLIASDEPGLFVPVRERVHEVLLGDERLLAAYRARQTPRARTLLEEGAWREVEAWYWLTEPGAEASLRLAQTLIESARFTSGLVLLTTLERHPDAASVAGDAAGLAEFAAAIVDTEDAWALAARLSAAAGEAPPARRRSERPEGRGERRASALAWEAVVGDDPAPVSLDGVVAEALHSAELSELVGAPARVDEPGGRAPSGRPQLPWSMPTIAGGHVLTADGYTISCFDRFTLRPRWRVQAVTDDPEPGTRELRSRLGRTVEDSASVTVDGGDAFASLGLARSDSGREPSEVLRIDIESGRVVWSVRLGDLDASLAGAEPRGPIVVDGDIVIVGARKNQRTRRLVGLTLVGLDRATGALRWLQSVGSAGSLPFQQPTHTAEGGVLGDGVVYWTDKIGLIAAVQTGTGRALWVRESVSPELYTRGARVPFATSLPVLTDAGLFVLMPDQSTIRLLDPRDGTLIRERIAEPFGDAGYLVRVGRFLASVGSTRVAFYDTDAFGREGDAARGGAVTLSEVLETTGVRGRAAPVGDRLAVPVAGGLALIDPERINADGVSPAGLLALDVSGNPAIADGQVVIAGESDVYSFLSWSSAERMLSARIDAGDAEAALSLAELAVRSGNRRRVLGAIDDAIRLVGRDRAGAARVFESVMSLLEGDRGGALGLALRGGLLERAGRVARTNEQRVAHAMGIGDWQAASGDVAGAARAYQDVLLEPTLAKAIWSGGGLSVRAELEASRRLQDLAERFGVSATRFAEDLAELRASGLGPGAEPGAWAEVAQRFPVTRVSVRAWERAASGWLEVGRWSAAERAARSGLRSLELAQRRGEGDAIDAALADWLAGTLVVALQAQSRGPDAPGLLDVFEARLGIELTPRSRGGTVAIGTDSSRRRARLGGSIRRDASPALIPGTPIATSVGGDPSLVLMHAPHLGHLALYTSAAGSDGLSSVWRREDAGSVVPLLVHADERALVLVWPSERAADRPARAESIDAATGELLWETDLGERISGVRPVYADPGSRDGGVIATPTEGSVSSEQLMATCDGRTLFVADRRGRAAGIDVETGRGLWAGALSMTRVFSIDMGGGLVGVSGARPRDAEPGFAEIVRNEPLDVERFAGLRGVVEAIDPRTGEPIQMLDTLDPNVRWVRVASDGQVIAGSGTGIVALDTTDGRVDWSNGDEVLVDSEAGWIVGEWLVVLDGDRTLWLVPRREGVRRRAPLETLGRGADRGWVSVERTGGGFVVYGAAGVGVYDAEGSLRAADVSTDARAFMVSGLTERWVVLVERPALGEDGRSTGRVMLVDRASGVLADVVEVEIAEGIRRTPIGLALADGVIVIGFGEASMVLRVPVDAGGEG